MRKDKQEVFRLRKLGKSYKELEKILGVPRSTFSDWLHKIQWSKRIRKQLTKLTQKKSTIRLENLNRIRGQHLARLYNKAEREARKEFEIFKLHPLFLTGLAIYWGEGDKLSRNLIHIANTDPLMIRLFVKFLQEIFGITQDKIRGHLLLYPDLDAKICFAFWVKVSKLLPANFNKPIVIQGRHKTKRLTYGVCTVGIGSTYLKKKMNIWLSLLPRDLLKSDYYPRG